MKLEARKLSYRYGDRRVLDSLDLELGEGELVALLGPNGVGKTTLFKCVLAMLSDYSGSILLDGREVRSLSASELARRAAYIPQAHLPAFDYSVLEVVLMGAAAGRGPFSSPTAEDEDYARSRLEALGIAGLADRSYGRISGGERQLALIARALAQRARLLVMDEPTANLDFGNQARVMEAISGLAEEGYGILLSTHNPEQAFLWAGRAAVLRGGRIEADGPPRSVLTEALLERLYGVPVRLFSLGGGPFGDYRACVPLAAAERIRNSEDGLEAAE